MRILVWGLGYVGTVSAACLAQLGHDVVGVDVDATKVEAIKDGRSAIKEPGLGDLIANAVESGRLRAVEEGGSLVSWADVSLICVGTPSAADGSPVLDYIQRVAVDIAEGMKRSTDYHVVALRSTVFPGTTREILRDHLESNSGKRAGSDFGLVMNPEFLREANAVQDFRSPPYTVIGELDERSGSVMEAMYEGIESAVHRVTLEDAEMLKLVNNAFHALKIGFANEVGRLCDSVNVDSHTVMDLVCADTKLNISKAYLRPGFAFGGSCLPKDLRSIAYHARREGVSLPILEGVLPSNEQQIESARVKVDKLGVRRVGILGLSFKSDTDDLRESPIIGLIRGLWQDGIDVSVYDPIVNLDEMLGSNLAYLERQLPQIHDILRARIEDVMDTSEAIIVTQNRPDFVAAVKAIRTDVAVLDLVHLGDREWSESIPGYVGLSW